MPPDWFFAVRAGVELVIGAWLVVLLPVLAVFVTTSSMDAAAALSLGKALRVGTGLWSLGLGGSYGRASSPVGVLGLPLLGVTLLQALIARSSVRRARLSGSRAGAWTVTTSVLGIVNTLVLSVSERTREIGLMRAVGLGRAQVTGEIMCESVLTAVYGTVLGGAVGVLLAGALRSVLADRGLTELAIPWPQLMIMLAAAIVVGVLAALWPALRALRLPVLQAIATE